MNEFDLIKRYFSRTSQREDVLLGVGDDAAILRLPPDKRLVAAVDTIVEGVHFLPGTSAAAVGHRALAVNLSDMAAMGAVPAWATLSLSLPDSSAHWLEEFARGFYALAARFNVALVGGDTVRGPLSITVSIMGHVEADRWLVRSGARPGDTIFVSGIPGEAAAGLASMKGGVIVSDSNAAEIEVLHTRFLWPEPRIELGRAIRNHATAAIDVSDGLLADLQHICVLSECGAHVDVEALPESSAMRSIYSESEREDFSLSGGDDYELLFTVAPKDMLTVEAAIASGVRCTPIGRMTESRDLVCCRGGESINVRRRGYDHFE